MRNYSGESHVDPTKAAANEWRTEEDNRPTGKTRRTRQVVRTPRVEWKPVNWVGEVALAWIDLGKEALGDRPPVNAENFTERLTEKVKADKYFNWALRAQETWKDIPGRPSDAKKWERGRMYCHDLLLRMAEIYWGEGLEYDVPYSSHQFLFVRDYWDNLIYEARSSIQLKILHEDEAAGKVRHTPVGVTDQQIGDFKAWRESEKQRRIRAWCDEVLAEPEPPERDREAMDRNIHEWVERQKTKRKEANASDPALPPQAD